LVLVERLLADDRVEEISALGHPGAGRRRRVALGIHQQIAGSVLDRRVEIVGHQHFGPVEQGERFPTRLVGAQQRFAAQHADHVGAQRLAQRIVHLAQHLVRLDHLDSPETVPQHRPAKLVHHRHMDPRDEAGAEVDANPVGLAMLKRGL